MSDRIRLAAVPFLSARPLTYGLEQGLAADRFELTYASPADCARRLSSGEIDLALLPSSRLPSLDRAVDWRVVPRLAVSSEALPVEFANEHTLGPLSGTVGDWRLRTGLPFVSQLWVGRNGAVGADQADLLMQSLEQGLVHLRDLAIAFAEAHGGDAARYENYLMHGLSYRLGSEELSGLGAFLEHLRLAETTSPPARGPTRIRLFEFANLRASPKLAAQPLARKKPVVPGLDALLANAATGGRLSSAEGIHLYEKASLLDLGKAADERRRFLHPRNVVTYIIDRNVNYTNLCVTACKFCNFYRPAKSKDAYTLSRDVLAQKFAETVAMGGIQILLQGGVNPQLRLDYYEDLFRWTKANFPLALHALSPEEVSFIAKQEQLSIREVLARLVAAGLDSLPGGGAEILDDEIRHRVSPLKCSADTWIEVMREAHALGLRTTATMVFGFGETSEHILKHLERLRALQEQTAGFTAFICWPFQAEGTRLRLSDDTTAQRYLRVFSLARLYLDNFPNLQVSWPTMGPAIGQVALRFGGNDFGSAMIEENVVSQAGAVFKLTAEDIEQRVRATGFVPRQRNMRYELLPVRREAILLASATGGVAKSLQAGA